MVEKEKDLKVKSIRSDRGGEFLSENFARWCKSEGIRRQLTTPYTPSQNGVVERKNRTIMEMARAMLAHASLPRSYWAEACNTAVYIQNRSPTHALQDMTPFQAYYGSKPTVSHFRVFGCSAFVHIPKEKRQKLDFKSRKLLFLGYSAESDAYRLYDPDTKTTTVSPDVVFDESFITSAEGAAAQPIPILPPPSVPDPPASPVITPSTSHLVPPIQPPPDVSPDHALSDSDSDLDVADATPEVDSAPPRREKRIPGWLYSTVASSGVTELPVPPPAGLPRRSNGPLVAFSISILIMFLLLSLLSVLMYCCWRKKQIVNRQRLCLLLKQERFRRPQGLLLNRRRMYERNIEYLQAELDVQPKSSRILDQLRVALEGLHFINRYLAMFPSDTLLADRLHQERVLVEDAMAASAVASINVRSGFWNRLMDSAFRILFGAAEEEDFTEELQILSEYDNCPPPATSLIPLLPKRIRTQTIQDTSGLQQSAELLQVSSNPVGRQCSGIGSDENSTEEYNNPLYNGSPNLPVPSTRKTVSFSPVNEVFEESEQGSVTTLNDSYVKSEENPEYIDSNVSQEEDLEYIDFDVSHQEETPEYVSRSTSMGFFEAV
ncbi:hypothetical protein L7F22_063861 [Adiantum nelumboides]|nr:hypothetical protein [Adiantum nelumboides]